MGISYSANPEQGTFTYFAGGFAKTVPEKMGVGFVKKELPAGEYIICRIEAESFEELVTSALNQANKYLFQTWLPRHKVVTEPFSAEKYYRDIKDINCMEIWVRPLASVY